MRPIQANLLSDFAGLYKKTTVSSGQGFSISNEEIETGNWTVDSPATFTANSDDIFHGDRFALEISNTAENAGQPLIFRSPVITIKQPFVQDELIFNCMVLCDEPLTVSAHLHASDVAHTTVVPATQNIVVGVFSPIFSNTAVFGESVDVEKNLKVTLVFSSVSKLVVTATNLTENKPERFNQISILSAPLFPDIYRDVDSQETFPANPMAKLYHSLTANMSIVMDKYVEYSTLDGNQTGSTRQDTESVAYMLAESRLTNPLIMESNVLPWAAQFVGSRITPDVVVNGNSVIPENFDFPRWQVQTKTFGQISGTRESIRNAAKIALTGNQKVLITPLWQGDEYVIMVRTLTSETPGELAEGDTSPEVLAVIRPTKPAGYVFEHETLDVFGFILNETEFGIFDQSTLG